LIEIRQRQLAAHFSDQQIRSTLGGNFHDRALARFNLGDLHGAQTDVREAIELQTVAVNAAPELSQCSELLGLHHELLGQLHLERGDADAALEEFDKACEVNPASVTHRWSAAWTCYDRLEFDKIVDLLSDFLGNAEELHLEYLLAVSLLYEERNDRAEQVIERLRSRHPESVEGHFLHGVAKMMKRDYADAVQSLGRAYQQKPGDPAILFNLSVSLAHANRKSEAQRVMAELSAIDSILAERVRRYLQSGKGDEAMQPMFELSLGS
jgi:tetratricopeptide (TPR) repeat protein